MATKFLEPGGDADFAVTTTNGFWKSSASGTIATDFVHGNHIKSIKYAPNTSQQVATLSTVLGSSSGRFSLYIYLNVLPSATATILAMKPFNNTIGVRLTSGGVLQIWDLQGNSQIGTSGTTLSTGTWYRLSLAYTWTSTTVSEFRLFRDGIIDISITNATTNSGGAGGNWLIGNINTNSTLDFRSSDHYADDLSTLTDTGNIWVTAKRPNANGTTNSFTTQIGSGGSGYGTGHSPQVNERALSTTNGWSLLTIATQTVEEYNIESLNVGDISLTNATIIDYLGWFSAKVPFSTASADIILNGTFNAVTLTTTITIFTKIAGSTTYPAGTGTDIGMRTSATLTTYSLYECGIIVAYIPGSAVNSGMLALL